MNSKLITSEIARAFSCNTRYKAHLTIMDDELYYKSYETWICKWKILETCAEGVWIDDDSPIYLTDGFSRTTINTHNKKLNDCTKLNLPTIRKEWEKATGCKSPWNFGNGGSLTWEDIKDTYTEKAMKYLGAYGFKD